MQEDTQNNAQKHFAKISQFFNNFYHLVKTDKRPKLKSNSFQMRMGILLKIFLT